MNGFFFLRQLIFLYVFCGVKSEKFIARMIAVVKEDQNGALFSPGLSSPGLHLEEDGNFVIRNTLFGEQIREEIRFTLSDIPTMIENEIIVYTTNVNEILHCFFLNIDNARNFYVPYKSNVKERKPKYTALKLSKCTNGNKPSTVTDEKLDIFVGSLPAGGSLRRFIIELAESVEQSPFLVFSAGDYGISHALVDNTAVIVIKEYPEVAQFFVLEFDAGISKDFVTDLKLDANTTLNDKINYEVMACAAAC